MTFESRGDQAAGRDLVEGLEVFAGSLVTDLQPPEVPEAGLRPPDDVAGHARPATVALVRSRREEAEAAHGERLLATPSSEEVACRGVTVLQ